MELTDFEDIVDRIGSDFKQITKKISSYKTSQLADLSDSLSQILIAKNTLQDAAFSFTASPSLSGSAYPCAMHKCRTNKIMETASFAALYADRVFVQDPFERFTVFRDNIDPEEFLFAIRTIRYLSPLIKSGIVLFSKRAIPVCAHCLEKIYSVNIEEIKNNNEQMNKSLKKHFLDSSKIELIKNADGSFSLNIKSSEEIISHGEAYLVYKKLPRGLKILTEKQLPYKFTRQEISKRKIYENSFGYIAQEIGLLEMQSKYHGTRVLTDNEMQLKLAMQIGQTGKNNKASNPILFYEAIKHSVPTILDIDLQEIVKLRGNETEAFKVYRDSLNKLAANDEGLTPKQVKEAFADTIKPEINKINKTIKDWREKKISKIQNTLFGSALVAAGAYSGLLPPSYSSAMAILGGAPGVAKCLGEAASLLKTPTVARESSNYFLWKMMELTKK